MRWGVFVAAVLACLGSSPLRGACDQELRLQAPQVVDGGVLLRWSPQQQAAGYRVEYTERWDANSWQSCVPLNQWATTNLFWLDPNPPAVAARFYRVVAIPFPPANRGLLLDQKLSNTYSLTELKILLFVASFPGSAEYAVEFHRVLYETVDGRGQKTIASGAILVPAGRSKPAPVLSFQHSTVFLRDDVPSRGEGQEFLLGVGMAACGYVVFMADYVGLGDSPGLHPFLHAQSEATSVVDLIRAGRSCCESLGIPLSGQLLLWGYSQGGHATLAAHREIELNHPEEMSVSASAPMAGPYDLSGTMAPLLLGQEPYASPGYMAYLLFGLNEAYSFFCSPEELWKSPYHEVLPPLLDGAHTDSEVNSAMPAVPAQALRPEFLAAYESDPNHELRSLLRRNDVNPWPLRGALRFFHCAGDQTVPYIISQRMVERFHSLGSTDVRLVDPLPTADHYPGAVPCFFAAKSWLDSFVR